MQTPDGSLATALARLQGRWGTAAIRLGNGGQATDDGPRTLGALALAPLPDEAVDPSATLARTRLRPSPMTSSRPVFRRWTRCSDPAACRARRARPSAETCPAARPRSRCAASRKPRAAGRHRRLAGPRPCLRSAGGRRARRRPALAASSSAQPMSRKASDSPARCSRGVPWTCWLSTCPPASPAGRRRRFAGSPPMPGASARASSCSSRPRLASGLHGVVAEATGLRLELDRSGWIRLGRDVVGQQTQVTVAKNRFGPPGRRVELEIHYADPGDRTQAIHRFATEIERRRPTASPDLRARLGLLPAAIGIGVIHRPID